MNPPRIRIALALLLSISIGGGVMLSLGSHSRQAVPVAKASPPVEVDADDLVDICPELAVLPTVETEPPSHGHSRPVDLPLSAVEILLLDDHAPRGPPGLTTRA